MAPDHYWRSFSMHTRNLAAASTLVLALCTLEVRNSAACDFGCDACAGYGYADPDFAYSSYPEYSYYAPVYYVPTNAYAYYPAANYVGPGYGPAQYAPPLYGYSFQAYRNDYYRPGYVSAPNLGKHTRIVRSDGRPALRGYAAVKQSRRALNSVGLGPGTAPQVKKPTTQVPVVERPKVTVAVMGTAIGLKQWPTHARRAELRPYEIAATRAAAARPLSATQRSLPAQAGGK
jgi:hypothetical protein